MSRTAQNEQEAWWSALAPLLRPVTLRPGDTLAKRPPALRFVRYGELEVERHRAALPRGVQVLGPGSVLGLKTLARWKRDDVLRPEKADARAVVPTELLELPGERFEQAFHDGDALLERLLDAREVEEAAVELVRVLSESPRLANAQDADLFRLVEGATPVKVKAGPQATPLFLEPAVPDGFYVVLQGCCDIASSSGPTSTLEAPTCVGLDEFLTRTPLPGPVMLRPEGKGTPGFHLRGDPGQEARAFRIGREWFERVQSEEPDFNRAVVRGCPERLETPAPPTAHQVIVWGEQQEGLPPWSALGALLAERMAVHLHEHVLVVRLVEGAPENGPLRIDKPAKALGGWVAHCERPPVRTDVEPLLPRSTATTWMSTPWSQGASEFAGRTNVTLVDTSALTARGRQQVLQQLSEQVPAEEPLKYLSLSGARRPPALELPPRVKRIHAGLLHLPRPQPEPGLGLALAELFQREAPLARTERAARAAGLMKRAAGRELRRLCTRGKPEEPDEWPMGAVRLLFPASWLQRGPLPTSLDGPGLESPRESFERWARAATGRRVGLALGGGGPFGFVSIALLDKLDPRAPGDGEEASELRVPIDMVAGSSFGAVVGAFYCVGRRKALELLIRQAHMMLPIVGLTAVSSEILELWTHLQLGPWPLDELEVPFFPVVTDADMGVEWDLRTGSIGRGVRASSALPPLFGPTLIGNRRLLDGGLVANVPANVLRAEGADILIAANPIARVPPRARSYPVRWVGPLWRQLNPRLRIKDGLRLFQMMGRLVGTVQSRDGETVVYQPQLSPATLLGFGSGQQIVERAQNSPEVDAAVLRARTAWRKRLNNARWLQPVGDASDGKTPKQIELTLPLVFRDLTGRSELRSTSDQVLSELVEYLHTQKEITSFKIQLTAPDEPTARQRAKALADYLDHRVFQQQPKLEPPVRLTPNGQEGAANGQASRVVLTVLTTQRDLTQGVMQEAASMMENYRGYLMELQQSQADVRMRTLLTEAERQGQRGAPELARLLALEAVEYARPALADARPAPRPPSPPPESQALLDGVLREVLERRGTCLRVLPNRAALLCAAWSPEGSHLATGDSAGRIHLWDLQSPDAEPTRLDAGTPTASGPGVKALVWAARSHQLACCDDEARVRVMTVGSKGACAPGPTYDARTRAPWGLQLSPDEQRLLGPYGEGGADEGDTAPRAAVLGVTRQERVPVCDAGPTKPSRCAEVRAAAWAPSGKLFATAGPDAVGVWRVTRRDHRDAVTRQVTLPMAGVLTVAWHPGASALAAGGAKGLVVFRGSGDRRKPWELETRQELETPGAVEHVAWSPEGQWLAAASAGSVHLWHADSGLLSNVLHGEDASLGGLAWNPRRRGVLATWSGTRARVWDVESGQVLATLTGHTGGIHQAVWSPDGTRLVTVSADATARIWDDTLGGPLHRASGEEVEPLLGKGAPGPGWSPDAKHVVVQDGPRAFSLWTASGELEAREEQLPHDLMRWVWHPGSKALGLVLRDAPGPGFWDLASKTLTLSRGREKGPLWDLAWSPSGQQLAIACDDGWARIYDCPGACALDTLLWSLRLVFPARRVAWSPDGQFLATGDAGGLVGIWDSRGYDLVASPQTQWGPLQHLVWNRSGSCLFTASEDGHGLLWRQGSAGRWTIAAVLETQPTRLRGAAFSHDGRWLLAMEADGAGIRLHPAEFETLVDQVASLPGRNAFTEQERTHYLQFRSQRWHRQADAGEAHPGAAQ